MTVRSPFDEVVHTELLSAAPLVREHFAPPLGIRRYEGVMTEIWRARGIRGWITAPFLRIGSWLRTLFPETGVGIPFEIVNRLSVGRDGAPRMTFERTFYFPGVRRCFQATMHYSPRDAVVLDALGPTGLLLVELRPSVSDGAMTIRSGGQWLTPFGLRFRIRLPRLLVAHATIREWQESDGLLGIRVTISNPLLGDFFGYEGTFKRVGAKERCA